MNEFLTTEEAAQQLGLKPNTLEVWRHQGRGPIFTKLGRSVRYRQEDIENFIENCRRCSTSEKGGWDIC